MLKNVFDFFIVKISDEWGVSYAPTTAGNIAVFLLIVLLFLAMASFSGRNKKLKVKQLVFAAMAMTLAVVTSFIKLPSLPQGGSITLFRMFFIALIGYLYGARIGVLTGIAYGFLDLILGPYVVGPVQLLIDYPIAFGSLGLAGVFSNSKYGIIKGYILGVFGRYICHVISGIIYFGSNAGAGSSTVIYSLGYNASYIVPEAIATIVILSVPQIRKALTQVKKMANES